MKRLVSFRQMIVLLCSVAAVVPVLALALPLVTSFVASLRQAADRELRLVAESAQHEVEYQLGQIITKCRSLTQDGDIGRAVRSVLFLQRADLQLRRLTDEHELIASAYLINVGEEVVTAFPDALLKEPLTSPLREAVHATLTQAESRGTPEWVHTIVAKKSFFLSFSIPSIVGPPAGVLLIEVSLAALNRLTASLAAAPTVITVALSDAQGTQSEKKDLATVHALIKWPTAIAGSQQVGIDVQEPKSLRLAPVKAAAAWWAAMAALLALVFGALGYGLSTAMSAPIATLTRCAEAVGRGSYAVEPSASRFSDFSAIFHAFGDMAKKVELQLSTERARAELEMNVLRNQMNPHFLFNSLNSVAAMVQIDATAAVRMLRKLSDLLRAILAASKSPVWKLQTEIETIQNYLELEKMRFPDRLTFEVSAPTSLLGTDIPPLVVQTLVENAIKHGVAPAREGGHIWVTATVDQPGWYRVTVANTGDAYAKPEGEPGIGLSNSQRRLEMLYGPACDFRVGRSTNGRTEVTFRLMSERTAATHLKAAREPHS